MTFMVARGTRNTSKLRPRWQAVDNVGEVMTNLLTVKGKLEKTANKLKAMTDNEDAAETPARN